MSKQVSVTIHVAVPDDVTPTETAECLFDTLCQWADEDLIGSVDGWDPA